MNLIETILFTGIYSVFIFFWVLIFTKIGQLKLKSDRILYILLGLSIFLLIGLILLDDPKGYEFSTFFLYISLIFYVREELNIDFRFFSIIVQVLCLLASVFLICFYRLDFQLILILIPNIGMALGLSIFKYIRFLNLKRRRKQKLIESNIISNEIEYFLEKFENLLKEYNIEQISLIKLILKEESEKWLEFSENIQEMYLKSLLQKKIITDI